MYSRYTRIILLTICANLSIVWFPVMGYHYNTAIQRYRLFGKAPLDFNPIDMYGPCKEIKFVQMLPISDPNCPADKHVTFENKKCVGVCPNVFEPNFVKNNKYVANRCAMCKPIASTVTVLYQCNGITLKIPVYMVKSCQCRYVSCECPRRKNS